MIWIIIKNQSGKWTFIKEKLGMIEFFFSYFSYDKPRLISERWGGREREREFHLNTLKVESNEKGVLMDQARYFFFFF